jgi:hypothetical protein
VRIERAEDGDAAAEIGGPLGDHLGAVGAPEQVPVAVDDLQRRRLLEGERQVRADERAELLLRRLGGGLRAVEVGKQPVQRAVEHEEEQLLLAVHVVIEPGEREPRRVRDVADRRLMKSAPRDDVGGGGEDGVVPGTDHSTEPPTERLIRAVAETTRARRGWNRTNGSFFWVSWRVGGAGAADAGQKRCCVRAYATAATRLCTSSLAKTL